MLLPTLCTPSPPTPGSPPGVPPNPGTPLCPPPASGSQGRFGGELTFFQRLIKGFGVGEKGERGEQRALARLCSVLGCWIPPLSSCCHSLTLGVSPSPRGEAGWGEMWDAELCFGVPVSSLPGHGDLGHQSLLCHPSRQPRPPQQPGREGDPPRGGVWGASLRFGGYSVCSG